MVSLPRKAQFVLPPDVTYLDGNSLGPLTHAAANRLAAARTEWGELLIRGWTDAGWMDQPDRIGGLIGALIGAPPGSVTVGDTLSVKVYQALAAALQMRPDRRVVLSDSGNFPSDLYMATGLIRTLGRGHELRLVAPQEVEAALGPDVAVLMLTEVDYRTGRRHDLPRLTAAAHEAGAVAIWDLAHSAGAIEVDLGAAQPEFAVGCTYKYLNGGPGAPAFIQVRPDLAATIEPALAGWLGHAEPFAFEGTYRPADGARRLRVGTPPVLQMAALEAALTVWEEVAMADVRAASVRLSERFIAGVERRSPELRLASPRDPALRGSHVAFAHPAGYPAMQALIARGVVGDFRAPDLMRFGITPLYLDDGDIDRAVDVIAEVMARRLWDDPAFARRAAVT